MHYDLRNPKDEFIDRTSVILVQQHLQLKRMTRNEGMPFSVIVDRFNNGGGGWAFIPSVFMTLGSGVRVLEDTEKPLKETTI